MKRRRVAVVIHAYYENILDEIFICLNNFRKVCGNAAIMFLTYPKDNRSIAKKVCLEFPDINLIPVENVGYDIGPFFRVLSEINLDNFDYVVKLHTKRDKTIDWVNFHCFRNGEWRHSLMSFCNTQSALECSLLSFEKDPKLGMIADRKVIDPSGVGQGCYREWLNLRVLRELGYSPETNTFVYGTMFMMRAEILKGVQGRVRFSDFSPVLNPHMDYGLALEWELAFPVLVEVNGYRVSDKEIIGWGYPIWFYFRKVKLTIIRYAIDFIRLIIGTKRINWILKRVGLR